MINVISNSTKPQYNLAMEEYAVKHLYQGEDILLLWQNEPSVIIGRNQNTVEEINEVFIKERGIHVVRRMSGGGAVYHDLGNLNFSFVTKGDRVNVNNYRKFTDPVIAALNKLGVNAEFQGRNDIVVDGRKVSGNAQYYHGKVMLHHGTLLFDSTMEDVVQSLNVSQEKITSKSIKSIRSRVENIAHFMEQPCTMAEFKQTILNAFSQSESYRDYHLTPADEEQIKALRESKYDLWDWNYGKSPEYNIKKEKRFPGGNLELLMDVDKGQIKTLTIYGDFFAQEQIRQLEQNLIGEKYEKEAIRQYLDSLNWSDYFYSITKDEFLEGMFY